MLIRIIAILFLFLVGTPVCLSQTPAKSKNLAKVLIVIGEFNRKLFGEFDHRAAIEKYVFKNEADEIDKKAGMEADFYEMTKKRIIVERDDSFYNNFYFHLEIPFVQWKLARTVVSPKTSFVDGEITNDRELDKIWDSVLKKLNLSEEILDEPKSDELRIKYENDISKLLSSKITKKARRKVLTKNLKTLINGTSITCEIIDGREYFEATNKIFIYKVAIKNGIPKIMRINRKQ